MVRLEVVEDFSALLDLQPKWARFARGLQQVTPFQLPEWQLTWWRHFGSGKLRVLVFRRGGELAGVIPCFLHEWEGRQQLTLIGSGISDYLEPAIAAEHVDAVVECLGEHLQATRDWDVCNWQDLLEDTPLRQLASIPGLQVTPCADTECTEISIDCDFDRYWDERPHGLRRNVRRYLEKAKRVERPRFAVTCEADDGLIDVLTRLHTARWNRHGESGMIVANRSEKFLREVAHEFARQKMLRLFSFHFQGAVVAVILSFPYRNVLFSYLSAFDPEFEALGFGRILLYETLRHAFEAGYSGWNFLRGEEAYKLDWGARPIPKRRIIVERCLRSQTH